MDRETKNKEQRLRRRAQTRRIVMRKSRLQARNYGFDNQGGYMLIDAQTGFCLAGERFNLSLDDVEAWLADYDKRRERG